VSWPVGREPLIERDVSIIRDRYVNGYIELDEFERQVEAALRGPRRPVPPDTGQRETR
jgi:hypothetical protein